MKLYIGDTEVAIHLGRFPAGETNLRIESSAPRRSRTNFPLTAQEDLTAFVVFNYTNNGDLIDLMLLKDAIHRTYVNVKEVHLIMHYLPYARQDRVCQPGESLAVKVTTDLINAMGFTRVFCMNIHSEVGVALLNNLTHISLNYCASNLTSFFDKETTVLVSPDAGANKKVFDFAKTYGFSNVVRADKLRNVLTGEITETKVYSDHIGDKDFLILDDILDHGGTFIALAKELRQLTDGKIYLYITHGLFSSGVDKFKGLFDNIYVSNLMMKPEFKDTYGIIQEV